MSSSVSEDSLAPEIPESTVKRRKTDSELSTTNQVFPPLMTAMSLNWMRFLSLLKGNVLRLIWLLALRNELKFGPHRVLTLAAFDIISQLPDLNLNG